MRPRARKCGKRKENGAPGGTRTPNTQLRRLVLYPLSYGRSPQRESVRPELSRSAPSMAVGASASALADFLCDCTPGNEPSNHVADLRGFRVRIQHPPLRPRPCDPLREVILAISRVVIANVGSTALPTVGLASTADDVFEVVPRELMGAPTAAAGFMAASFHRQRHVNRHVEGSDVTRCVTKGAVASRAVIFLRGERPGSNRRPSEPQSDALTN